LVVHKSYAENADPAANPIGTGPFELVSWNVGTDASVKRREEGWWGGKAYLDGVNFIDYGDDPSAEVAAFESGEIHTNYQTTGEFIDILDALGLEQSTVVTAATVVLGYSSRGVSAENHHVCPIHPEYAELPKKERDLEGAKQLMAEAGHSDTEFELISIDDDYRKNTADVVAAQLREAGFNVKRTVLPGSTFWNDWTKYPYSITNWNMRPLGVQVLALAYRSGEAWNESAFNNEEFDAKLAEALATPDAEKRRGIMKDVQSIMQDEGMIIQPYWRSLYHHSVPEVKNNAMHQTFEQDYEATWIDA